MESKERYVYNINGCIQIPEYKWEMTIGDLTLKHTTEYSKWKAFWLRFMGWEVINHQHNRG